MSRFLVTGGAGAVGSNLVRRVLEDGHEVTVLDDLSSGHRELVPAAAEFIEGSVTSDADLERAFACGPDYVIHMATLFANQNSVDHPERDHEVNGGGTLNVLERSTAHRVRKMLYVSSSCVYGDKEIMREDDRDFRPGTPYAITKLLGERYCRFWADEKGLDVVSVRLFNTYGPGEYPGRYRNVIPNFFKMAMEGEPLPVTGTGEETRDFNYVDDTVGGMLGALMADTVPGDVFNIASGREITILTLAEKINAIAGNRAGVEVQPRRRWDHVLRRRGDITKAHNAFGHAPKVPLDEGLSATYAWLKERHV